MEDACTYCGEGGRGGRGEGEEGDERMRREERVRREGEDKEALMRGVHEKTHGQTRRASNPWTTLFLAC